MTKMFPMKCISEQMVRRVNFLPATCLKRHTRPCIHLIQYRGKANKELNIDDIVKPVAIENTTCDSGNVGVELTGALQKKDIEQTLKKFTNREDIKLLVEEQGLTETLYKNAMKQFSNYCIQTPVLPTDLHIALSDIIQGAKHVTDIFPYFLQFAKKVYPHIECLDDLKKISDLTSPAKWYPLARSKSRKIIFHAGPTNSGKTYHALERFTKAQSGVYCGPLKLLVAEVFRKCKEKNVPCDLITGEERIYINGTNRPSNHLSCSIEMVNTNHTYEVAIIDEIQLMKDPGRGWAWTKALLGIPADEIHLCGEVAAVPLVEALCKTMNETVEVRHYERLTELIVEDKALVSFSNIQPGDCIVCMNKNDIYSVSRTLERRGIDVAVIYGSLPPGTKLAQAHRFNDIKDKCKVMVATNAIGMGLNLDIRRIIFYSLDVLSTNESGRKEMDTLSVSAALQIAGRAGRYGRQWEKGYVTTFRHDDLQTLKLLLKESPPPITKAGLHPTAEQIELYAYYLPNSSLSNLIDIFVSLCQVDDSLYFMCNTNEFKFIADMIEHIPLPLRVKYTFCCAPINKQVPFVNNVFMKFARQYSLGNGITFSWLCKIIGWPFECPKSIADLVHLEGVFDILDLYLWLSYRFPDFFPDSSRVKEIRENLDVTIQQGVFNLTKLMLASAEESSSATPQMTNTQNGYTPRSAHRYQYSERQVNNKSEKPLTKKLIDEGLLTSDMLKQLQDEWMMESDSHLRATTSPRILPNKAGHTCQEQNKQNPWKK